ncbi:MAG: polymer-forming cytoskeletal protein [Alphaproteobacteria bacterium]|nr:polymer-forming cytoskeletal protein [Alphaproteobacteria bacterium]
MPDDGSNPTAQEPSQAKPAETPTQKAPPAPPAPAATRPAAPRPLSQSSPAPTRAPAPATPVADGKLVLGKGVSLAGHVTNAVSVMVEGDFSQATIEAGELVIGQAGRITGQAVVTSAEVRGHFEGELTVQDELIVHETGSVSGTIRYGEFQATRGARLEGDIRTIGSEAPARTHEPAEAEPAAVQAEAPAPEPDKRSIGGMLRRK